MPEDIQFAPGQQRQLLDRYREIRLNLAQPLRERFSIDQRKTMARERDQLLAEYAERLPFFRLSRCPFCQEVLDYPIETSGLDAPWWHKGNLAEFPRANACEHFRVLLGAIDFKGAKPVEAALNGEVVPGAGVPFVVPRLLDELKCQAVVWSFIMPPGYRCFPIAYFSEEPAHGAKLHQPWGRQAYQVLNENGQYQGWWVATDPWEFDFEARVKEGTLKWIAPGDRELQLRNGLPCPFVGLPGVRSPQIIEKGNLRVLPPPTGQQLQPFE